MIDQKDQKNQMSEQRRLQALHRYRVLDTPPEKEFDDITALAAHICDVPMALISLVDENRQWFKSAIGIDVPQTERCIAFCDHAIRENKVFVVGDAQSDQRFSGNPLVTNSPNLRFYAGAPLVTPTGELIGTLCVLDGRPKALNKGQIDSLERLARQVVRLLEARLSELLSAESKRIDLASINESIPQIVWQIGTDGQVLYMNHRWHTYTGLQSVNVSWADVVHADDAERAGHTWRMSMANGEQFECEYRLRRHDGAYRWFLARGIPQRDESGKILKWFGTSTDIHDQKEAEEIQNNFFSLPNLLLCLATSDGYFVRINKSWSVLLGYSEKEILETKFMEFMHPDDRENTSGVTTALLKTSPSEKRTIKSEPI